MPTDTPNDRWNSYMAAYSERDVSVRTALLEFAVADEVVFTNPGGQGSSRADLITHIGNLQNQIPGATFRTDKLYDHHGEILAVWSMFNNEGSKLATGYNFVRCDEARRFVYMAGFF